MLAGASCGHLLQQLATQAPPAHCWSPHHTSTGFLPTLPSSHFWTPDLCSLSHPALSWTGSTPNPTYSPVKVQPTSVPSCSSQTRHRGCVLGISWHRATKLHQHPALLGLRAYCLQSPGLPAVPC